LVEIDYMHNYGKCRVECPALVLSDDPQTMESAWSKSQSERREMTLVGDVLGMAGPGKKIAGTHGMYDNSSR
jgi:hypothetical protein